ARTTVAHARAIAVLALAAEDRGLLASPAPRALANLVPRGAEDADPGPRRRVAGERDEPCVSVRRTEVDVAHREAPAGIEPDDARLAERLLGLGVDPLQHEPDWRRLRQVVADEHPITGVALG